MKERKIRKGDELPGCASRRKQIAGSDVMSLCLIVPLHPPPAKTLPGLPVSVFLLICLFPFCDCIQSFCQILFWFPTVFMFFVAYPLDQILNPIASAPFPQHPFNFIERGCVTSDDRWRRR